jgi:hypothetical protein
MFFAQSSLASAQFRHPYWRDLAAAPHRRGLMFFAVLGWLAGVSAKRRHLAADAIKMEERASLFQGIF